MRRRLFGVLVAASLGCVGADGPGSPETPRARDEASPTEPGGGSSTRPSPEGRTDRRRLVAWLSHFHGLPDPADLEPQFEDLDAELLSLAADDDASWWPRDRALELLTRRERTEALPLLRAIAGSDAPRAVRHRCRRRLNSLDPSDE